MAYVDDAGNNAKNRVVLYGGVILDSTNFIGLEAQTGVVAHALLPGGVTDTIQEFKGHDLFKGTKRFEAFSEDQRFEAISLLLQTLPQFQLPFVYCALDREVLAKSVMSTVDPRVVAFSLCVLGIEDCLKQLQGGQRPKHFPLKDAPYHFALLIVDDNKDDAPLREQLKTSYRQLRSRWHSSYDALKSNRLWHLHDAMYFGDSRDSTGLQLADLCSYFMGAHLSGKLDQKGQQFYEKIAARAICAKPMPEWNQYQHLLLDHEAKIDKAEDSEGSPDSGAEA